MSDHYDDIGEAYEDLLAQLTAERDAREKAEKDRDKLAEELRQADAALSDQRAAHLRWRDLVLAVTTAADIQTAPPAAHMVREMDTWRDGLSDDEAEALSAALDIAANARHGETP